MDAVVLALGGVLPLADKTSGMHLARGCAAAPAAVLCVRSPRWVLGLCQGCVSPACPCPVLSAALLEVHPHPRSLTAPACPRPHPAVGASGGFSRGRDKPGRRGLLAGGACTRGFPRGAFCWQGAHCNVWLCMR